MHVPFARHHERRARRVAELERPGEVLDLDAGTGAFHVQGLRRPARLLEVRRAPGAAQHRIAQLDTLGGSCERCGRCEREGAAPGEGERFDTAVPSERLAALVDAARERRGERGLLGHLRREREAVLRARAFQRHVEGFGQRRGRLLLAERHAVGGEHEVHGAVGRGARLGAQRRVLHVQVGRERQVRGGERDAARGGLERAGEPRLRIDAAAGRDAERFRERREIGRVQRDIQRVARAAEAAARGDARVAEREVDVASRDAVLVARHRDVARRRQARVLAGRDVHLRLALRPVGHVAARDEREVEVARGGLHERGRIEVLGAALEAELPAARERHAALRGDRAAAGAHGRRSRPRAAAPRARPCRPPGSAGP